jgi:NhaA family Na+:H+ antiporter
MATDIAFVVGSLALIGSRVPPGLRVMLLSLAIADDIGAILVIAIGYTAEIHWTALGLGALGLALIYALKRLGVRSILVYVLVGALVWIAFHASGVHATIAGVVLGLMTPAERYLGDAALPGLAARAVARLASEPPTSPHDRVARVRRFRRAARESLSPLEYLEALIHPWVGFAIMPLFALANAGVVIEPSEIGSPIARAVGVALVLGKPIGILIASWIATRIGIARLPDGVGWRAMLGAGCLAGIGFTMALFIAALALEPSLIDEAKVGVLAGSAVSAILGLALLVTLPKRARATD